jgi:hypothetical protein
MIRIEDAVIEKLVILMEMARDTQFAIGDQILEQVELHKNKSEVISYLASQLNVSASTLYDYCRVSEVWKPEMREVYQSLDWTIYRNANPNDPDDIELLNKAIDEGWNATKFKEEKYPAMKDPTQIIGKLTAIIERNISKFTDKQQRELSYIMNRLKNLIDA